MKEETNATTQTPSEAQMNDMHKNAWLDFHADAQEAKQELSRRYAKLVSAFGSYKNMPDSVKEIVKQDYAENKAQWGTNGTEQQKRFGTNEPDPSPVKPEPEYKSLAEEKEQQEKDQQSKRPEQQPDDKPQHRHADNTLVRQEFIKKAQHVRSQQMQNVEVER